LPFFVVVFFGRGAQFSGLPHSFASLKEEWFFFRKIGVSKIDPLIFSTKIKILEKQKIHSMFYFSSSRVLSLSKRRYWYISSAIFLFLKDFSERRLLDL